MIRVKGLTRVKKGNYFETPRQIINELKDKLKDPNERVTLEQLLYDEFK